MNYKEPSFELDERQISFKNASFIPVFATIIVTTIIYAVLQSKHSWFNLFFSMSGGVLAFLMLRHSARHLLMYKTKVLLTDILHIEIKPCKDQNGKFSFKGTGSIKTFFPSGLDKSNTENVFLLHYKNKKAIIGFTPNNCSETIAALKQHNIKIIES